MRRFATLAVVAALISSAGGRVLRNVIQWYIALVLACVVFDGDVVS